MISCVVTGDQKMHVMMGKLSSQNQDMSRVIRKPDFAYAKSKSQISFAVTAKLISVFVFATRIVQSLFYLNPKFQASSHLLWLYSPVFVGPGRKSRRPVFSQRGSYNLKQNANRLKEPLLTSMLTAFALFTARCT